NLVTAEPGSFIITKAKSKEYEDAVKNNDKIKQQTILQNIRNNKEQKENSKLKFKYGSFVTKYDRGAEVIPYAKSAGITPTTMNPIVPDKLAPYQIPGQSYIPKQSSFDFNSIAGDLTKYGPALYNLGKGAFGRV